MPLAAYVDYTCQKSLFLDSFSCYKKKIKVGPRQTDKQTKKQTDRNMLPTPADSVGVGNKCVFQLRAPTKLNTFWYT